MNEQHWGPLVSLADTHTLVTHRDHSRGDGEKVEAKKEEKKFLLGRFGESEVLSKLEENGRTDTRVAGLV